jgi:hypothetical protein
MAHRQLTGPRAPGEAETGLVQGPSGGPSEDAQALAEVLGSTPEQASAALSIVRALTTIATLAPRCRLAFEHGLWERDMDKAREAWEALGQIERALREIRGAGEDLGELGSHRSAI